jgi:hypothetical protein
MKGSTIQSHRAAQVWSVLVFAARHQELVTYATIEKLTRLPRNGLGAYLNLIADYCKQKKLPDLWTIVVNEKTGFPAPEGKGELTELEILCKQQRAFAFNWFSHDCPRPEEFK